MSYDRTDRFESEYKTAAWLKSEAAKRGLHISLFQAHRAWMEHSDDYCAQWLMPDAENPTAEAWKALTKWQERHPKTQQHREGGK